MRVRLMMTAFLLPAACAAQFRPLMICDPGPCLSPQEILLRLRPATTPVSEAEFQRVTWQLRSIPTEKKLGRNMWRYGTDLDRKVVQNVTAWLWAADATGRTPEGRRAATETYTEAAAVLRGLTDRKRQAGRALPARLPAPSVDDTPLGVELGDRYTKVAACANARAAAASGSMAELAAWGARMQLYLDVSADTLRAQEWEQARINIKRAEAELERLPPAGQ